MISYLNLEHGENMAKLLPGYGETLNIPIRGSFSLHILSVNSINMTVHFGIINIHA